MLCAQGNLAIAQGKQAEFDFEQDCQRTPAAIAADLKEADLAHHAERLVLQRFQDSQFLGRPAAEHKSQSFLQLFPVRIFCTSAVPRSLRTPPSPSAFKCQRPPVLLHVRLHSTSLQERLSQVKAVL